MATHCSILAWRIQGTEEPSGLPSMGSHRVGHNRSDLAAAGRSRIMVEGDLRVEIGRIISPLYFNFLPVLTINIFWLIQLISEGIINLNFCKIYLFSW